MQNAEDDIKNTAEDFLTLARERLSKLGWDGGHIGKNITGKLVVSFSLKTTFQIDPTDPIEKVELPFNLLLEPLLEDRGGVRKYLSIPFVTTRVDPELCACICSWAARGIGVVIRVVEDFVEGLPRVAAEPVDSVTPEPIPELEPVDPSQVYEEEQLEDPPAPTVIELDENNTSAIHEYTKYLRVGKGKQLPDHFRLASGSLVFTVVDKSMLTPKTYMVRDVNGKLFLTREDFKPLKEEQDE